jgi:hypothetical protein
VVVFPLLLPRLAGGFHPFVPVTVVPCTASPVVFVVLPVRLVGGFQPLLPLEACVELEPPIPGNFNEPACGTVFVTFGPADAAGFGSANAGAPAKKIDR